jgi:16S rRNA (cytosine1402-N4)-methyltransferase
MASSHFTVLLNESIDFLQVFSGGLYIDATLGAGGHSEEILKRGGKLLAFELDEAMMKRSYERLEKFCPTLVRSNFTHIKKVSIESGFSEVDGVLFDLGISMLHYTDLGRGFSFKKGDEKLDMRLDPKIGVDAAFVLNQFPQEVLKSIFEAVLVSKEAQKAARKIVSVRQVNAFEKVTDLSRLFPDNSAEIFLAIRMAVNDELGAIESGLRDGFELLKPNGRMAVISFHSTEHKLVTRIFEDLAKKEGAVILTHKPVYPSPEEIQANPASRSAQLRVIERK